MCNRGNYLLLLLLLFHEASKFIPCPLYTPGPYVNIYLTYDGKRYAKWKSTVHYDTAVPVFNETFQFNVSKMDLNLVMLCVHVKEYHR